MIGEATYNAGCEQLAILRNTVESQFNNIGTDGEGAGHAVEMSGNRMTIYIKNVKYRWSADVVDVRFVFKSYFDDNYKVTVGNSSGGWNQDVDPIQQCKVMVDSFNAAANAVSIVESNLGYFTTTLQAIAELESDCYRYEQVKSEHEKAEKESVFRKESFNVLKRFEYIREFEQLKEYVVKGSYSGYLSSRVSFHVPNVTTTGFNLSEVTIEIDSYGNRTNCRMNNSRISKKNLTNEVAKGFYIFPKLQNLGWSEKRKFNKMEFKTADEFMDFYDKLEEKAA